MKQISDHVIDWLRFRYSHDVPNYLLDEIPYDGSIDREIQRNFGDGEYIYRDYSGTTLYPELRQVYDNDYLEITRLDLCVDYLFNCKEHANFKKVIDDSIKIKKTRVIDSFEKGYTAYFEGVKGLKIRFYQKGLKHQTIERWYRLEFEIHNPLLKQKLQHSTNPLALLGDLMTRYTTLPCSGLKFKQSSDGYKAPLEQGKRFAMIYSELKKKEALESFLAYCEAREVGKL